MGAPVSEPFSEEWLSKFQLCRLPNEPTESNKLGSGRRREKKKKDTNGIEGGFGLTDLRR